MLSNTYNSKSEYLATMEGSLPKKKKKFVVYPIYVVLAGRDKYKGKDIDDFFYALSLLLKW